MPAPSLSNRRRSEKEGRLAETAAVLLLRAKGYRILATRFSASGGEIDIVCRKRDVLAFVEVKRRPSLEGARLAVSWRNQQRIKHAAGTWLARHERRTDVAMRFDIVASAGYRLLHIRDAFR
jgi:putative endonuclease